MHFVIKQNAGQGVIFTQDTFSSQIGEVVPLNLKDTDDGPVKDTLGLARLVKADIIEDGHAVELTLEIPKFDPSTCVSFPLE